MRHYDKFFEEKLRIIAKCKKVLDVGGGAPFQKYLAKYKSWFENCKFETLDCSNYYKPTIVGDIHNMPVKDNSYDGIMCMSVLEHVDNPLRAADEIYRIMKKKGVGLVFVPSIYPYHAKSSKGSYPDNYRFLEDGINILFKKFKEIEICKCGGYLETLSVFLPGHKYFKRFSKPVLYLLDGLLGTRKRNTTYGYYIFLQK